MTPLQFLIGRAMSLIRTKWRNVRTSDFGLFTTFSWVLRQSNSCVDRVICGIVLMKHAEGIKVSLLGLILLDADGPYSRTFPA
ncbi:unnamed protein product [Ceratitis capitata]|uniref:(Mediterranean fruit fly) hypothetical protein n=1 Tax=Ceratitis capitata TaxID=7213 RepID=A0A811UBT6_CERCA|nr:unnamed protein product [Ceratitis capitata]